ncbi:hypothetical protein ACP2AV_12415 [Aliiroseovarius sp. PTFE2010]|uniref:hypothetical protein n=1 Tax=Aliiroseovarius sp. PTFE2010 TaxID=3417190 RepID=UPI003CF33602
MDILQNVADELAQEALKAQLDSGDEMIVDRVGEALGASSQTLQEAYQTAVRVRRAEARALAMLAEFRRQRAMSNAEHADE